MDKKNLTKWHLFKWGAKNHPGNGLYILIIGFIYLGAFNNQNLLSAIVAATVGSMLIAIMYIFTSISVGQANKKLVLEELKNDDKGNSNDQSN